MQSLENRDALLSSLGRTAEPPLVEIRGLKQHFSVASSFWRTLFGNEMSPIRAVDGIDLAIARGESFGLIGESGSGKSTLGMSLVRLYEPTDGEIIFGGQVVNHLKGKDLREFRKKAQIIFQDPYSSMNPRLSVKQIVEEPLRIQGLGDSKERRDRVKDALERARFSPSDYLDRYPHELSGGERQRVAISRAVVLNPDFIVADEPTSMLDVSLRAGVLDLLRSLCDELDLAVLYVSHDIATVRHMCERVGIMYLGVLVEVGSVEDVIRFPAHPYTKALMAAVPLADPTLTRERVELHGEVPTAQDIPSGCRFRGRCPLAMEKCSEIEPSWREVQPGHFVACHLFDGPTVETPMTEGKTR